MSIRTHAQAMGNAPTAPRRLFYVTEDEKSVIEIVRDVEEEYVIEKFSVNPGLP
jgi:hypothetical protein